MQARFLSSGLVPRRRHVLVPAMAILWLVLAVPCYASDIAAGAEQQGFAALEGMAIEEMRTTRAGAAGIDWVNVQSIQKMEASVNGATFIVGGDIATGDITFDSDAIAHYHGVGVFNVITGNANAVNSAVGISIYITE